MFGLPGIFWPANGGVDLALQLVVRTILVYLFFLVAMRVFGKREVGQFTMPDLVLVLLAANALQPAITGPDSSLGGAGIILATMFILNSVVSWLRAHSPIVDRLVSPDPTTIYGGGEAAPAMQTVPDATLARWRAEGLTRQDVFEALHEQGIESLDQVDRIYLEESGRITVIPRAASAGA